MVADQDRRAIGRDVLDAVDVEEGFTIVSDKTGSTAPSARTESPAPSKVAAPSVEKTKTPPAATPEPTEAQGGGERKKKRGKKKRKGGERTERPAAQTSSPPPQKREPVAAPSPEPEPTPVPTPDPVLNTTEISETDTTPDAPVPERRAVRRQIQMVFEELSGDDAPSGSREPRVEFVRLVNQVLKGIARSIDGRSIVFFWVNLERGHFIPEAAVTRGDDPLRVGERITLGSDLVSQIARGGVPEIVTNISPAAAAELTPYYGSGLRTGSFVGVPVFFRNEVVGVLAADSAEEEGFDEAAVATLAEYTILISQLIGDYAEKFDLYLVRRSIEAFESMNDSLTGAAQRPFEVARYLVDEIADMFDADYVGAILYDRREGAWRIAASRSDEPALRGRLDRIAPDMGSSIAGEAARRATEIYIPSVSDETLVAPGETLLDGGSYLAVPLMAASKCYGSLILGNARTNAWVSRDVELMRDLTRYAAMAIEVINTNAALDEQMIYDEQTGLYNSRFFMRGFEREVDRAHDFKATLSLALVRVEIPDSFGGDRRAELHHTSVAEIGALLTRKVRPYDLLGRFDNETFSVALVGRSDQEAFLWAEQLRKEIAGHIIPFDAGNYSVTISAGVCNATDTSQTDNVIEGAHKALEKAGKDGGNGVVIY